MGVPINNESTTTEIPPWNGQQPVVEAQQMFNSHGGFQTIAIYHHGETIKSN